jgi:hypothetical protein
MFIYIRHFNENFARRPQSRAFAHVDHTSLNTVKPGYNDIGLRDTPSITSDILWYQLIPHC